MEENNIVRYHNDLNSITFYKFGSIDFDLFMSICSRMADKGIAEIRIPFEELRNISGFNNHWSEKKFISCLDSMNGKQLLSQGRIETDQYIDRFNIFRKMRIDKEQRFLYVQADEEYLYILNELKRNFTRFELQEFVGLDSKYSKTLYRLLKQYRTTGLYRVTLNEFKRLLSIPKSYSNKYISDKIIKPSMSALSKYFNNLAYKVLYEAKRGRPVKGYEFTFAPEKVPRQIQKKPEKDQQQKPANKFHNFEQRTYDYDEIERALLNRRRPT